MRLWGVEVLFQSFHIMNLVAEVKLLEALSLGVLKNVRVTLAQL